MATDSALFATLHAPQHAVAPADEADAEASLLRRARRGDHDAFARLYALHADSVHTLAWRLTADRALAEDIVQETFLRMLGHLRGLDPGRPARPWLKQVAARIAIDRLRRRWRERPQDVATEPASADTAPDAWGEALGLLGRLSPQERALVWLHQVEGWTHVELGRRFGRSESWSKSIVSRALAQLRAQVEREIHDVE